MPGWPVPPDFPLHELVGQEVMQVAIGQAWVHVQLLRQQQPGTPDRWKPGARIDIESGYTLDGMESGSARVDPHQFKREGGALCRLLGETVVDVAREPANELRIRFSNGSSLRLHTDPRGFESFHLQVNGESITVTGG